LDQDIGICSIATIRKTGSRDTEPVTYPALYPVVGLARAGKQQDATVSGCLKVFRAVSIAVERRRKAKKQGLESVS
jgi:hypothetical protein